MDYKGKIITRDTVEPTQTSASGVWTLDQAAQAVENNTWPIANVPNPISRSLRFNSADSAYLNRTPASASSLTTWTWSCWFKRSALGARQSFFSGGPGGSDTAFTQIVIWDDDKLRVGGWSTNWRITTQVFRDVSAWMHLVVVWDTGNGTAADKVRVYVNGSRVTAFDTSNSPTNSGINQAAAHAIGRDNSDSTKYFSGYMAQTQFIDGQALDPTYFGMTDPRTGAWISKPYTGTYGTNGFYLNFSDNSSTAALGTDYSGNNNTWTTNNFSVTAGSGNDSMVDVPTNWVAYNTGDVGGVIRGNYATANPLLQAGPAVPLFSNGNLTVSRATTASEYGYAVTTFTVPASEYWYAEFTVSGTYNGSNNNAIGLISTTQPLPVSSYLGTQANAYAYLDGDTTTGTFKNNSTTSQSVTGFGPGTTVMIAFGDGKLWFGRNGVWLGTGSPDPSTATAPAYSGLTGDFYFCVMTYNHPTTAYGYTFDCNFGQRPFAYTPPAGFKSLCTTNLPEPTILDGGDYFNAVLWTGNSSASQAVTGVGFQPDLVWAKSRPANSGQDWSDSVRGATKLLQSNNTNAESTSNIVLSFDADGFTVGDGNGYDINKSGESVVGWCWKESATSGFDIVTYTGDGNAATTVAHNLGVTPSMIIIKNRTSGSTYWSTYHTSLASGYNVNLNETSAAFQPASGSGGGGVGTSPTSSVFGFIQGTSNLNNVNASANAYVAYLFAAVPGFSAFGSYTGNGSADGPFVYTGFRPKFVIYKSATSGTTGWGIKDATRNPYNVANLELYTEASSAEVTTTANVIDFLSNGFKLKGTGGSTNASGGTFIYMAFAENPFKYSNAR